MSYSVLAVGNSNIDQGDHRKLVTALSTPTTGTSNRTGIFPSSGDPAGITNSDLMVAGINPFRAIVPSGGEIGDYVVTVNEAKFIEFDPGEASVVRSDRIILRVYSDVHDGLGLDDARVEYLKGQSGGLPNALPDRSILLWEIPVPAGASEGGGGINFTSIAVDNRVYTTAHGGILPLATTSSFPSDGYDGMPAYVKSTNTVYVRDNTSFKPVSVPVATNFAGLGTSIANTYTGLIASTSNDGALYSRFGGVWEFLARPDMIQFHTATVSSNLTLTTTPTDATGGSVTFTTTVANAVAICLATFDFDASAFTATGVAQGFLNVDGSDQTAQALFEINTVNERATIGRSWPPITLASAGSHTIKLRGGKSNANNTVTMNAQHSTLTVVLFQL